MVPDPRCQSSGMAPKHRYRCPRHSGAGKSSAVHDEYIYGQMRSEINLLMLSREWMGMGESGNGMIINNSCGSFPKIPYQAQAS